MTPEEAQATIQALHQEEYDLLRQREEEQDARDVIQQQLDEKIRNIHCMSDRLKTVRAAIQGYRLATLASEQQTNSGTQQSATGGETRTGS